MANDLTVPEMHSTMRRLFEELILAGHLRPVWAEGYEPVRIGSELGWRFVEGFDEGLRCPIELDPDSQEECLVSTDQLHRLYFSRVAKDRPGARVESFLFFQKKLPVRWNARAVEEEYFVSDKLGWAPRDAAALEVACLAMKRRARNGAQERGTPAWVSSASFDRVLQVQELTHEDAGVLLATRVLEAWVPLEQMVVDLSGMHPEKLNDRFFGAFAYRIAEAGALTLKAARLIRWEGVTDSERFRIQQWIASIPTYLHTSSVFDFLTRGDDGARERVREAIAAFTNEREMDFARRVFLNGESIEDIANAERVSQPMVTYRVQRAAKVLCDHLKLD